MATEPKKPRRRVDPREVNWRIVGVVTLVTLIIVGWYAFATSSGDDDEVSSGTTLPDVTTTTEDDEPQGPSTTAGANPAAGPGTTAPPEASSPTTNPASAAPSTTTTTAPAPPPVQNLPDDAPQAGVTHTVRGTLLIDAPHTIAPGQPCGGQGQRYQDFQVGQTVVITDTSGGTIGQGILESCAWDGTTPCPSCGAGYESGRPQFTFTVGGVPEVQSYVMRVAWAVWQPVPIEDMRARDWVLGLTMA